MPLTSVACRYTLPLCLLAIACSRSDPDPRPTTPVAAQLFATRGFQWHVIELPQRSVRLYVQEGAFSRNESRSLVDSVEKAQDEVLTALGATTPPSATADGKSSSIATLFFVGSRNEMTRLIGRPLAGMVQPGEATAAFVSAPGYRAPLRHELAHLYTFERWGQPSGGEKAWLVEGIGAWAGGPCLGHSPDALAAEVLRRRELPSAAEMSAQFRRLREDVAVPAAGSLVSFLHRREGIEGLRSRWMGSGAEALPDSALEASWRAHLQTVRPATLDVSRVMREGC